MVPSSFPSLPHIFRFHVYLTMLNKLLDFFVGFGIGFGATILYVNPIIHKMGGSFDLGFAHAFSSHLQIWTIS